MDTQTKTNVAQVVAQVMVEEHYKGQEWEPYPQPRAWAMQWDVEGLDYALRRNGHRPDPRVSPDKRVLK
ncbi:MAG: hypothetical protein JXA33_11235 [Anaerolineae bacterium]|nr:hypothetical protein [Anaerolineae bacterium]